MRLFWDLFRRDSGYFRGGGGEGALSAVGRGPTGGFELQPGTPVASAPNSPSFLTTEGKHPRGSQGPDKGDRRSLGVERKDPERIRQALNRGGSGQAGHGP